LRNAPALNIIRADIPVSVNIAEGANPATLKRFFLGRVFAYDLILISRRPTVESVGEIVKWVKATNRECKIIFDFEALPPLGALSRQMLGKSMTQAQAEDLVRTQIADVSWVDGVICNSVGDARELRRLGRQDATAVSYLDTTAPTAAAWSERKDMLFVGRLAEEDSPNVDGLAWFVRDVWPIIVARLGAGLRLLVAGLATAPSILKIRSESVEFIGVVPDLRDLYNGTKVFVAANRVSFGVPIKVLEAAAHGLPVVTTNEVNSYLGWENGAEILCADSAAGFAEACIRAYQDPILWHGIRDRALAKVDAEGNRHRLLDLVDHLVPRVSEVKVGRA
jgi:glycosyltransferase involved in cell wall biosynthesis